jgi:hypothetical protein
VSPSFFQSARFPASVGVLFLGWFLVGQARGVWTSYWLLKDERQAVAVITGEHGHNVVDYSYRVNGTEYKSADRRRYLTAEHRYENAVAGEQAVVYYSSSHPGLSRLTPPNSIIPDAFGAVILFLAAEVWLIFTLINPDSKWAYKEPRRPTAS